MPPSSDPVRAAEIARDDSITAMRISIKETLANIDREAPDSLSKVVTCLMVAQFDQTEMADCCGFNRTTISRWSQNLNIPRSPVVRAMLIGKMLELLDESIKHSRARKR